MLISGKAHCFGDHIDTDVIIPSQFTSSIDPDHLADGCFGLVQPGFRQRVSSNDVIVAGENFGCGSSREHAAIAIKATGIGCVIAASFSRLFFRNAINIGLPVIVGPEVGSIAKDGDLVRVDLESGVVELNGTDHKVAPFPEEVRQIFEAGGLVGLMKQRWNSEHGESH